jgi:hypothetical protein
MNTGIAVKKPRSFGLGVLLGVILGCFVGCVTGAAIESQPAPVAANGASASSSPDSTGGPAASSIASASTPTESAAPEALGVTMAGYSALHSGMSYEKAVAILGSPGQEISSNDLMGIHTAMYMWQSDSGANMNAMFQRDRLISKTQLGLQ